MKRRLALLAMPAILPLWIAVSPVSAAGDTYTITADRPEAVPSGENWTFDDFFPRSLTVVQGSTLNVAVEGFHTFTLLAPGTSVSADLKASGIAQADSDDTTLNVNRSPRTELNFKAIAPELPGACGTTAAPCSFTGAATISSGVPLGPAPGGPFVVTVDAAPGLYAFHCRVHAGMVGALRVVPAGAAFDSPAQVDAKVAAQTKVDVAEAKIAEARATMHAYKRNPNGTATWRVSPGTVSANGKVSILEFLPKNVTLHKGDRVMWVADDPNEPHTITFPNELNSDQVPLCDPASGPDTPATPGHMPPTGPTDFTCPTGSQLEIEFGGGNGVRRLTSPTTVADSGIMTTAVMAARFGLPADSFIHTWSVTIQPTAVAGTYTYICQIHQGMAGTLTVK